MATFLASYDREGKPKDFALVDRADYDALVEKRWHKKKDGYFYRNLSHRTEGKGSVALHRELLGLDRGNPAHCDHINRNTMDNRRANLRVTDAKGNAQNRAIRSDNSSGFKGVRFYPAHPDVKMKKRWRAYAFEDGREIALGYYETPEEAGRVAAEYRSKHYAHATD